MPNLYQYNGKEWVEISKNGSDYILTENDKKEIAKTIKVPIVEKIIEKTEVMVEQPIVTEITKEIENKDTGEQIITKINEDKTSLIKVEKIDGLAKDIKELKERQPITNIIHEGGGSSGLERVNSKQGVSTIDFGTNLTVTNTANGVRVDADNQLNNSPSGGVKSWFFTKDASDVGGMYVATTTLPTNPVQTIIHTATDGESTVAEFITPLATPTYRVTEGSRFFYFTAKVSNVAKDVQLRGEVYTTDLAGGNQILLRSSTLTIPLTLVDAEYSTSVYGGSLIIDSTTTRVMFKVIAIKQAGGVNPTVTLSVDDDTFSRLDVPSPVGVTDVSGLVKLDQTTPQTVTGVPFFSTGIKIGQELHFGDGYNLYIINDTTDTVVATIDETTNWWSMQGQVEAYEFYASAGAPYGFNTPSPVYFGSSITTSYLNDLSTYTSVDIDNRILKSMDGVAVDSLNWSDPTKMVMGTHLDGASAYSINNILSGTFGLLDISGDRAGGVMTVNRTPATPTNGAYGTQKIKATHSGDMGDGFGVAQSYIIQDNAGVENTIGNIQVVRAGADNTGTMYLVTYSAGVQVINQVLTANGATTFSKAVGVSTPDSTANIQLYDTTSSAAGVGGGISFFGNYTGTSSTVGGGIKLLKSNATAGNWSFDLGFYTRLTGGSNTGLAMKLTANGNMLLGGATTETGRLNIDYVAGGATTWLDLKTGGVSKMQLRYYGTTSYEEFDFYAPGSVVGMNFKTDAGGLRIVPWTLSGQDVLYFQSTNQDFSLSGGGGAPGRKVSFLYGESYFSGKAVIGAPNLTTLQLNVGNSFAVSNASSCVLFLNFSGKNYIQSGLTGAGGGEVAPMIFSGSQGYPELFYLDSTKTYTPQDFAVGHTTPSASIHAIKTTEQLRLGYNTTNYFSTTVGSTGSTTFALTGTTPTFTFSQAMTNSVSVTSPAIKLTSSTPTIMSGDVNNYDLGNKSFIRLSGGAADRIVTGIVAQTDGHVLFITNIGTTNKISFANESASSTAANRIMTTVAGTVEIPPAHSIQLIYDATTARWRELSHL